MKSSWSIFQKVIQDFPMFHNEADPKAKLAPETCGVYFVGSTHFDPNTDEPFYLAKVGKSVNLYNRMKEYTTTNPMMFHMGYEETAQELVGLTERAYQYCLSKVATAKLSNCAEWWILPRDLYLRMSNNPFEFFHDMVDKLKAQGDPFFEAIIQEMEKKMA